MGNEVGESAIFFRAQEEYGGGPIQAEKSGVEHRIERLYSHIGHNGVKNGDPYISMTEAIETALLKYSYGHKAETKSGRYKYNKTRAKVLLINLPMQNACETARGVPSRTNGYFTTDVLLRDNIGSDQTGNFIRADCEAVAYGQIDEEYVHEVHPMLVDLLFALKAMRNTRAYDEIVNKIITGELSVQAVNEKFFKDGVCVESLDGKPFNDVERAFIESYYGRRENIVDTCDQCFPERKEGCPSRIKMELGTAVRVGLIKRMLREYIPQELSTEVASTISNDDINNFMMAIEEDTVMSAHRTDLGKRKVHLYGNVVLDLQDKNNSSFIYGIRYSLNRQGQVLRYGIDEQKKEIVDINGANELATCFREYGPERIRMIDPEEERKKEEETRFGFDENGIPLRLIERINSGEKPPSKEEIKTIYRDVIEHYKEKGERFPIEKILFEVCKVMIDPSNVPICINEVKIGRKTKNEYQIRKPTDEEQICNRLLLERLLKVDLSKEFKSRDGTVIISKKNRMICDAFLGAIFDICEECDPKFKIERALRAVLTMQRGKIIAEKTDLKAKYDQAKKKTDKDKLETQIEKTDVDFTRSQEVGRIAQNRVKRIRGHAISQEDPNDDDR